MDFKIDALFCWSLELLQFTLYSHQPTFVMEVYADYSLHSGHKKVFEERSLVLAFSRFTACCCRALSQRLKVAGKVFALGHEAKDCNYRK